MQAFMLTAAYIIEYHLGIGMIVVLLGIANDLIRHRTIGNPIDALFVAAAWPYLFVLVYRMWKRGELE